MICPESFIKALQGYNIDFFVGVPDSLLKELCQTLQQGSYRHLITANEGNAVAMAIGHHLATGRYAAVYMQNSGIGNAVNPLVSLAAREIYQTGMLLIIGWRGEPGVKDEPQHLLQGQITEDLLKTLRIPFLILDDQVGWPELIDAFLQKNPLCNGPAALLVRKGTFAPAPTTSHVNSWPASQKKLSMLQPGTLTTRTANTELASSSDSDSPAPNVGSTSTAVDSSVKNRHETLNRLENAAIEPERNRLLREDFLELLLDNVPEAALLVATTGITSRELFEIRDRRGESQQDFLTVGGMGHASLIALGIAINCPDRKVFCLDGDGAMLMHLGALPIIGCECQPANYVYIMLNNAAHESVGGQPTVADRMDTRMMAKAFGFKSFMQANDSQTAAAAVKSACSHDGPAFIEVSIRQGHRKDLGRPTRTPAENKADFMRFISGGK